MIFYQRGYLVFFFKTQEMKVEPKQVNPKEILRKSLYVEVTLRPHFLGLGDLSDKRQDARKKKKECKIYIFFILNPKQIFRRIGSTYTIG